MQCPTHKLAVGPNDQCMLCRRESDNAQSSNASRLILTLASLSILTCIGVFCHIQFHPNWAVFWPQTQSLPTASTLPPNPFLEDPADQKDKGQDSPRPQAGQGTSLRNAPPSRPAASSNTKLTATENRDRAEKQARLQQAMRQVQVKVYYTHWCPACTRARAWLDSNGVSYSAYDVEHDSSAKKTQRSLNPSGTIPTIDVEGIILVGFSSNEFNSAVQRAAEAKLAREYVP